MFFLPNERTFLPKRNKYYKPSKHEKEWREKQIKRKHKAIDNNQRYFAAVANQAYKAKRLKKIGSRDYRPELSSSETAVYQDTKSGKYIIGFRGTTLEKDSTVKDLSTDILIGLGVSKLSNRTRDALKLVDEMETKYGKENIQLTGHSLGGTIAKDVGDLRDISSYSFNAGSSPLQFGGKLLEKTRENEHHYVIKGDPVSASLNFHVNKDNMNYVQQRDKSVHPHKLENFL